MNKQQNQVFELTPHNTLKASTKNLTESEVSMLQDYLLHILQFGTPEERIKILNGIKSKFELQDRKLQLV